MAPPKLFFFEGKSTHKIYPASEPCIFIIPLFQDYAMNYWKSQGAPAEKLIVGFPTYGNTFTLRSAANHGIGAPIAGAGTPGKYTQEAGELAYFEVRFLITVI